MNRIRVLAAAFGTALLGAAPAASSTPSAAPAIAPAAIEAVTVDRTGGFAPRPRRFSYRSDGTALLEGVLDETQHGRFRAQVDYAKVRRVVAETGLCSPAESRDGVPRTAMDLIVWHVTVRCGDVWRVYTTSELGDSYPVARVRDAVRGLEALLPTLAWKNVAPAETPPPTVTPSR